MEGSQSPGSIDMSQFNSQVVDPQDLSNYGFDFNQINSPATGNGKARMPQVTASLPSPISALSQDMNEEQMLMRPSHDYERFKQQTGLPSQADHLRLLGSSQGSPNMFSGYNSGVYESQSWDMPSQIDPNFEAYLEMSANDDFIDPTAIMKQEEVQANIRYFPGMHQQAAMQKQALMAKQKQREAAERQQQQQRSQASRRSASSQPLDARTEETISRVMNEIRRSSNIAADSQSGSNPNGVLPHIIKAKRDEDDMDEDERLLNSEEGKKLSSKERRQLRNKVSARAFRSRRKEYISQLEGDLSGKANEAAELRRQNHLLMEENARFRTLAEKLLSHPAFHPFLDELSRDPDLADSLSKVATSQPQMQSLPKDVDPFASQQFVQQNNSTQVGLTMIPEMPVDLSSLNIGNTNWNAQASGLSLFQQPQVFAVTEVPQLPSEPIDFEALSGKGGDVISHFDDSDEKATIPEIEQMPAKTEIVERAPAVETEESESLFDENDPTVTLFASSKPAQKESEPETPICEFSFEKGQAHFEMVISTEQDQKQAVDNLERMVARLESSFRRIDNLIGS